MRKSKNARSKKPLLKPKNDQPEDLLDIVEVEAAPTTILDLPLELLRLIFRKYLTTPDRKAMRLVNSVVQVFIDRHIGYDVTVDENDPKAKFKFLSEVVLQTISFYNLTKLKRPKAIKVPSFLELFSYPQCLREVHIELELTAGIFNSIVRLCPSLEIFNSSLVSSLHADFFVSSSSLQQVILPEVKVHEMEPYDGRYLPKLKSLRMMFKETTDSVQRRLSCEAVLTLMKSLRSPFLDCVILQLNICEEFSIAEATHIAAVFLARNPNLTKFFFGMLNQGTNPRVEEPRVSEKLEQNSIELFKKAGRHSKLTRCGIGTEGNYAFRLWKTFFKSSSNLVHMSFTLHQQDSPFTREWFIHSKDTLQQFIFRGDFTHPFDFECLQDCHNLKEICLHNLQVEEETTNIVADDILNLHLIPKSVRSLILFQTVCSTDEIMEMVNRLTDLETLALYKLGNSGEAGISIACIRSIMRLRKLKSLLLLRFVASNTTEADELVKILQLMGTVTQEGPHIEEIEVIELDSSEEDDLAPDVNNNFIRPLQRNNFDRLQQNFHDRVRFLAEEEESSTEAWDDDDDEDLFDNFIEPGTPDVDTEQVNDSAAGEGVASSTVDKPADEEAAETDSLPIVIKSGDQIDENIKNPSKETGEELCKVTLMGEGLDGQKDEELLGACGGLSPTGDKLEHFVGPTIIPSSLPSNPVTPELEETTGLTDTTDLPKTSEPTKLIEPMLETSPEPEPEINPIKQEQVAIPAEEPEAPIIEPEVPPPPAPRGGLVDRPVELGVNEAVAAIDDFIVENRNNFQLMVNLQNENDLRDILNVLQPVQAEDNNILFGFILEAVIDITDVEEETSSPSNKYDYGKWKSIMNPDTGDLTYELKLNCFLG